MAEGKYTEEDLKRILEAANTVDASSSRISKSFQEMGSNISSASDAISGLRKALIEPFDMSQVEGISATFDLLVKQRAVFMGTSLKEADALRENVAKGYSEIVKFGGTMSDTAQIQLDMLREFNVNSLETSENVKELFLSTKLTGVETTKIVTNFREAGIGVNNMGDSMLNVINYARSIGVSVQAVAGKVTEHIGKLNLYNFEGGVQGLSKMAAQASLLNIDMGKTFKLAEDLLSPDKAIELSSSLQRLGVTSSQLLDPLRAMDLAQNDPAELQNQLVELSKQFVRTKEDGSFEILPGAKRQIREVAQALGMSAEELAGMANKASMLDKKMSEIRFPDDIASDENKQLVANLARMGDKGEYVVDIKQEVRDEKTGELLRTFTETKSVSELRPEDIEKLKENSGTKTLEDLSEGQLTQLESINNKITELTTATKVAFGASQVVPQMKDFAKAAFEKQYKVQKGDVETPEFMEKLLNRFDQYTDKQNTFFDKILKTKENVTTEDIKKFGENVFNLVKTMGGETFGRTIQPLIETLTKDIPGGGAISKFTEENKETIGGILTVVATLMPSMDTLTKKMDTLITKLGSVFGLKDFIFTKGNLYSYDENDLFIGGTKLLGPNQQAMSPEDQKKTIESGTQPSPIIETKPVTETTELTALFQQTEDLDRSIKDLLELQKNTEKVFPSTSESIDIAANLEFEDFDIPEIENITTHVKVLYDVEELKLPDPVDLTANLNYNVEDIITPEIKDLNGKINYGIGEMPDISKIEDITANVNYKLGEVPKIPEIEDLNGKINYHVGSVAEKPKIENVTAFIDYKVNKLPDETNVKDLTRTVNYESGKIPKTPEFENPTVFVNYKTGEKPEKFEIKDITGNINYVTGEVSNPPSIKDITAHINYELGDTPDLAKVEDLKANVKYNLGEIPKNPEVQNVTSFIDYKTGNVEELKLEDKVSKINYVKGDIEEFKLPDTKDMIVNVKYNVEDLKLPENTELTAKVKLEIENQTINTELTNNSLDELKIMANKTSEIKYNSTQVATPDTRQNVRPNFNTENNTIPNQEIKVNLGEMKVVIEIPGLNNTAETQRVATEAIHNAFNNETFKRNLSQMFAQGIKKTNGILDTSGTPNYAATPTESTTT